MRSTSSASWLLRCCLVRRHDPRPGDVARPGRPGCGASRSTASRRLGWRGSARALGALDPDLSHPGAARRCCRRSAPNAAPSVMYAGTVEPGWHDTLLPASSSSTRFLRPGRDRRRRCLGALSLSRRTPDHRRHLDVLGRLMLAAGLLSTYCYCADFFFTALGGDVYDRSVMLRRLTGALCEQLLADRRRRPAADPSAVVSRRRAAAR